jgi:hypothetical protein
METTVPQKGKDNITSINIMSYNIKRVQLLKKAVEARIKIIRKITVKK